MPKCSAIISSPQTQVQFTSKLPSEVISEDGLIKFSDIVLSTHSKSDDSMKTESKEMSFKIIDEVSGGKSDTTISESLSTDPLKLPENIDNLSLKVESVKIEEDAQHIVPPGVNSSLLKNIESTAIKFNDLKLDTDSIEGLQIRKPPLVELKRTCSNAALSRSLSEVSEKMSCVGSHTSSKSVSLALSRSHSVSLTSKDLPEKIIKVGSSKSIASYINLTSDMKSVKESLERSAIESLINNVSAANEGLIETESIKRSRSKRSETFHSGSEEVPSKSRKLNRNDLISDSYSLIDLKKHSSFEDLVSEKSVAVKSLSDGKDKLSSKACEAIFTSKSDSEKIFITNENVNDSYSPAIGLDGNDSGCEKAKDNFELCVKPDLSHSNNEHSVSLSEKKDWKSPKLQKSLSNCSIPGPSNRPTEKSSLSSPNKKISFESENNSDSSSGFTLLQLQPSNLNLMSRSSKGKKRSEKSLQKMFYDSIPFSTVSSNSAQVILHD